MFFGVPHCSISAEECFPIQVLYSFAILSGGSTWWSVASATPYIIAKRKAQEDFISFALDDLRGVGVAFSSNRASPITLIANLVRRIGAGLLMPNLRRPLLVPKLRLLLLANSEKCFAHVGPEAGPVPKGRVEDRFHDDAPLRRSFVLLEDRRMSQRPRLRMWRRYWHS
jgi:hypothetical protein